MILIIDNYDSFTYNLVQLVGRYKQPIQVKRNDKVSIEEIATMKPERILISPGPGRPELAGICIQLIRTFGPNIPILGVCLGHQAIGYAFGGTISHAPRLMHGKTSMVHHTNSSLYRNISNPFEATRYHSLVVTHERFPDELEITASTNDNVIMGIRHKTFPIEGIQFHPESVLTTEGFKIVVNWLG